METTTITISNPTPYAKKVINELTGKEEEITMVNFTVTGSPEAVEQYYKDQCDDLARQGKEPAKKDDKGNPRMVLTQKTAIKYGNEAVLTRTLNIKGHAIYLMEDDNSKVLNDMIKGASAITQRVFAEREYENLVALSKEYTKNKVINRSNYLDKLKNSSPENADLSKL